MLVFELFSQMLIFVFLFFFCFSLYLNSSSASSFLQHTPSACLVQSIAPPFAAVSCRREVCRLFHCFMVYHYPNTAVWFLHSSFYLLIYFRNLAFLSYIGLSLQIASSCVPYIFFGVYISCKAKIRKNCSYKPVFQFIAQISIIN